MKGALAMQSGKSENGKYLTPGSGRLDDVNGENFALVWTCRNTNTGFIEQQISDGYDSVSGCMNEIREWWDMSEIREAGLERMRVEIVFPGGAALNPFDSAEPRRAVSYHFKINGADVMSLYPDAALPLEFSTIYFGDALTAAIRWVEYSTGSAVEIWRVDDTSHAHVFTMKRGLRDGQAYYPMNYSDAVDADREMS